MKTEINERIGQLRIELSALETVHDKMVKDFQAKQQEFQQRVQSNQLRFQQITGAITELNKLLQHEHTTDSGNGPEPHPLVNRIFDPRDSAGGHLGTPVVHRKLDQPYTSTGKISVGDNPPDPGDPMGPEELHGG